MEFEFDPAKSESNHRKHGIDFFEAQTLWKVFAAEKPLNFPGEARFYRIAPLEGRFWTAIFTLRGVEVRLISVRRGRRKEVDDYERAANSGSGQPDPQP